MLPGRTIDDDIVGKGGVQMHFELVVEPPSATVSHKHLHSIYLTPRLCSDDIWTSTASNGVEANKPHG